MQADDTVLAYIIDTQIEIFEQARLDLQLSIPKIAQKADLSVATVQAWAQGRNALSLWGLKKLLRVEALRHLLSRLFDPEEAALVPVINDLDHDAVEDACREFLNRKAEAHHKDSPKGRDISDCERDDLDESIARLRSRTN
ncbi:hypothetical protein [Novosphingobium sp. KN65.2]|uniref:hypothetical protein n=1 Tax=Novosphingobium sp. KN65.2 TaxID=1478134 RepID=UPI0005E553AE|nr:hypothetical protein [Novosphingobium sp. KN65.2]CDO34070.1 hypothetical protein SPHV1_100104 [Novosphingobium sp. KN65.2]